jgi:hypothetical protein
VQLLIPEVAPAAQAAVQATFVMRGVDDQNLLAGRRESAIAKTDELIASAGRHLLPA